MDDSRANPASAPEAGRQIADHRRNTAWLAAGAHGPTYQRLPEMRARRRAPGLRSDGELRRRTHPANQCAPRTGARGSPLAGQLSETEGDDRDDLRDQP